MKEHKLLGLVAGIILGAGSLVALQDSAQADPGVSLDGNGTVNINETVTSGSSSANATGSAGLTGSGSGSAGANATVEVDLNDDDVVDLPDTGVDLPDTGSSVAIDTSSSGGSVDVVVLNDTVAGGAVSVDSTTSAPAATVDAYYGAAGNEGSANLTAGLTPGGGGSGVELPGTIVGDLVGDSLPDMPAITGSNVDAALTADVIAPAAPLSGSAFGAGDAAIGDATASGLACLTINGGACEADGGDSPIPSLNADGSLIADVTSDAIPASGSLTGSADAFAEGLPLAGDAMGSGLACVTINGGACEAEGGASPVPGLNANGALLADVTSDAIPGSGRLIGSADAFAQDLPLAGNAMGSGLVCVTINAEACEASGGSSDPAPGINADGSLIADVTSEAIPASGSLIGAANGTAEDLPVVGDGTASGFVCVTLNMSACGDSEAPPGGGGSGGGDDGTPPGSGGGDDGTPPGGGGTGTPGGGDDSILGPPFFPGIDGPGGSPSAGGGGANGGGAPVFPGSFTSLVPTGPAGQPGGGAPAAPAAGFTPPKAGDGGFLGLGDTARDGGILLLLASVIAVAALRLRPRKA
jgi:hypothetical protein